MKGFILSSEEETIAVISLTTEDEFYVKVRTAIAEHYVCESPDDVSLDISFEDSRDHTLPQSFDASSIENGGEESLRTYNLMRTCIY